MKLGTAIKAIRTKNGLKQFELAQRCDITQTYLSQIENNLKEPNISTLKTDSSSSQYSITYSVFFIY